MEHGLKETATIRKVILPTKTQRHTWIISWKTKRHPRLSNIGSKFPLSWSMCILWLHLHPIYFIYTYKKEQLLILDFALYFSNHVLQISPGIETMGGVRLELFGYLVLAWVLVYLVIWKGLQNSGKVNYC